MPEIAFDDDTALAPDGHGAYGGEVDPRWWTPRGPLGGYVMALVMRALTEDGQLWNQDGTLVAQSRQFGLLIGAQAEDETAA